MGRASKDRYSFFQQSQGFILLSLTTCAIPSVKNLPFFFFLHSSSFQSLNLDLFAGSLILRIQDALPQCPAELSVPELKLLQWM